MYTPFEDQDNIPDFDAGNFDFTFGQLFRDNRFSGVDRVGDANQLTLALTTRLLDNATGVERFRAQAGQILYFRDREVTLRPGAVVETDNSSDLIAELGARIGDHWLARGSFIWDPGLDETERASGLLQYRVDSQRVVNLSYRFKRDDFEETDLSFAWPLTTHWKTVGRWNYSLRDTRDLEILGGLEYENCCWTARLVGRRFIINDEGEYNNEVYVQLVFKGLTSIGDRIDELLEQGILGYETND